MVCNLDKTLIWAKITYLESAAMLFLKLSANIYGLGLSNELLFIIIAQGAAKMWPVKAGDPKKSGTRSRATLEWAEQQNSFQISNFDRSQFCNTLSYDDK